MKLNLCKCRAQPSNKTKKTDTGKLVYYAECPKFKSKADAYYGASKQKVAKEWNKANDSALV